MASGERLGRTGGLTRSDEGNELMRLLFWISALGVGYVYIGYPALLVVWAKVRPRPSRTSADPAAGGQEVLPRLSIVIAARNEAARLRARIENLLALDYPSGRREILVVSDGSTDDTLALLSQYEDVLTPLAAPAAGKAAALNLGVAHAAGDILIFADARQMFAPNALRALVAPFADPEVGGVTGELLLDCEPSGVAGRRGGVDRRRASVDRPRDDRHDHHDGPQRRRCLDRRGQQASTIADGVGLYWRYEKQLRRLESIVGSTLGATGAIYALRRPLYRPLPANTILDDVLMPMRAVLAGHRVVFTEQAVAFDRAAADAHAERRRKVRTLAGNFQILWQEPRLLMPVVNPVWLQYVSHKLGRLLVPYALVGLFIANIALVAAHPFYALTLAAQCALYVLAGYGAWLDSFKARADHDVTNGWLPVDRLARVALTFLVMNYAAVAGLLSALSRRHVWR
jgi:cellulose synthase/poly-beta-1,6-N-acetylglucosamine synthase-like glycosyltransferase